MDNLYIPLEMVMKILDNMDISQILAFLTTDRSLSYLLEDINVLRYISISKYLPFVSKFQDLVILSTYGDAYIYTTAIELGDMRLVRYYSSKYDSPIYLEIALEYNNEEVIKYLADKTQLKSYSFHIAGKYTNVDIIKYLLSLDNRNKMVYSALEGAIEGDNREVIDYLLDKYKIRITREHIERATMFGHKTLASYLRNR